MEGCGGGKLLLCGRWEARPRAEHQQPPQAPQRATSAVGTAGYSAPQNLITPKESLTPVKLTITCLNVFVLF